MPARNARDASIYFCAGGYQHLAALHNIRGHRSPEGIAILAVRRRQTIEQPRPDGRSFTHLPRSKWSRMHNVAIRIVRLIALIQCRPHLRIRCNLHNAVIRPIALRRRILTGRKLIRHRRLLVYCHAAGPCAWTGANAGCPYAGCAAVQAAADTPMAKAFPALPAVPVPAADS